MIWRELKMTGEISDHIDRIDQYEQHSMPRWFRDSSQAWSRCPTAKLLVEQCQEVYGLFDSEGLKAVVYIETQKRPIEMLVHLSMLGKIDREAFLTEFTKLRNELLRRGVKYIRGWLLKRNKALIKMLIQVGFIRTGLKLDHGMSHGRVLRWELYEVRRG